MGFERNALELPIGTVPGTRQIRRPAAAETAPFLSLSQQDLVTRHRAAAILAIGLALRIMAIKSSTPKFVVLALLVMCALHALQASAAASGIVQPAGRPAFCMLCNIYRCADQLQWFVTCICRRSRDGELEDGPQTRFEARFYRCVMLLHVQVAVLVVPCFCDCDCSHTCTVYNRSSSYFV